MILRSFALLLVVHLAACTPAPPWDLSDPSHPYADVLRRQPVEPWLNPQPPETGATSLLPETGPLHLTIELAALVALEGNRDLRVQRLTPQIVATFEDIERAVYDPELFLGASILKDEGTEVSRATGESFSTEREDSTLQGGVRTNLPTGTTIELGASVDRSTSNRTTDQQIARVGLTLTQALLRGFGPDVNLAQIRKARLETEASLYELRGFTEAVLADAESTYWRFAQASRQIEIFEQSFELARLQNQEVRQRIEIGVLPQTEAATAEAELAQRSQDLIDARSRRDVLRLQLLRLLNLPFDEIATREIIAATDPSTDPLPIESLDERLQVADIWRSDLNEARLRLAQRRLDTIVTRNGLLPRLDLFITLGKTGYADSFSGAWKDIDGPNYDLQAGIDFAVPLGNRAAEAANRGAVLSVAQASEAIENLAELVRLDVLVAAAEVERARQQIGASAATRALREEAVRAESERFRVGDSTSLLVAQAQRDLLASRIAEVDAVIAYRLALIQLHVAEGTLLARRGLVALDR